MTIYIFSGSYSLVVIAAESEERAREIAIEQCVSLEYHKLSDTYEDGEEFIEVQEG